MSTPTGVSSYPVTRFCMVASVSIPLLMAVLGNKYLFLAQFDPFVSQYGQWYRLALFQFCPLNESDALLLLLIWYNYRHLERLLGSVKYAHAILLSLIYTTVVLAGLIVLVPGHWWNRLPSGSLPCCLALFHFYKQYTPTVYTVAIGSGKSRPRYELTDQVFINTLVLLLLINQGGVGLFGGFIGWLVGIFIDRGLLPGLRHWRLRPVRYAVERLTMNSAERLRHRARETAQPQDEPQRSLGRQFVDTFRR